MNQASRTDILNIFLIIISFLLAINIPFELFLFSYAILGPLHYLTEINWLNDKNFFIQNKKQFVWLSISIGLFITMIISFGLLKVDYPFFLEITNSEWYKLLTPWVVNCLFIIFISSLIFTFLKHKYRLLISMPILILISYLLQGNLIFIIIFGVFLPTIIHVYLFTSFFMLYGALKSKSKWGLVSFFTLISVAFLFLLDFDFTDYKIPKKLVETYMHTNFQTVNYFIATLFEEFNNEAPFNIVSNFSLKIQSFIAFAYTYHYLNWFTKTTTIKWHVIKSTRIYIIICIWIFSVALYYVDYKIGFTFLLFLSFLHVFLEFPLNAISVKGIVCNLLKR